ncbi:MAG TPA: type IV toxin-antitoxin system AbiEi family antitoxin domain-containing protein [Burkholderiaceae bacterium]
MSQTNLRRLRPGTPGLSPDVRRSHRRTPGVSPDRHIAQVAHHHHGIVSKTQLLAAGLSESSIDLRLASGRLHRMHRGAYAVGFPAATWEAKVMAAVLAGGPHAVAGRRTAMYLMDIMPRVRNMPIEIMVPRQRPIAAVTWIRTGTLRPDETSVSRNVPAVGTPRMLVDLGYVMTKFQLTRIICQVAFRHLLNLDATKDCYDRNRTRRGNSMLPDAIRLYLSGSSGTGSVLEDEYLEVTRIAGLPEPLVTPRLPLLPGFGELEVDTCYSQARLVVEIDGKSHLLPPSQATDQHRDALLRAAGYQVLRVTSADIRIHHSRMIQRIRALLGD